MGRLTERDEYGNADIIGVDSADLQLNLYYDEFVKVTDALNRLAAYEDSGLTPEEVNAYARAEKERRIIVFESYERMKEIQEIAMAERNGRLVVLPCRVGDTVDRLFSHNEIIAIWEEHKNEEASPKYMLWKGMAHALPMEYQSRVFVRIFGTIPESIMDADTVNILVTPCITPRAEAEATAAWNRRAEPKNKQLSGKQRGDGS